MIEILETFIYNLESHQNDYKITYPREQTYIMCRNWKDNCQAFATSIP